MEQTIALGIPTNESDINANRSSQYSDNKQITDGHYDQSLAVKCVNGTFVGKKTENVIAYKGIPFVGQQPVGELRWKAPVDYTPSDGVYEAYDYAKGPQQLKAVGDAAGIGSLGEDCLYLNVWKADDAQAEKKPVMVYIHGGAFEYGATAVPIFECHNLVKENPDVIVVTIAYRLGVFGFLHLSHLADGKDYPDAQNLGLMDQIMGLKWVHENIEAFGGDPDNVTIWGESAGAASVTLLPLVKGSHQYFRRVIAQSGTPAITRSTEEAIACTDELMEQLGCKTVADLQKVDVEKLLDIASDVLCVRTCPERDGDYLPQDPFGAYADGAAKDIDFLLGCNKDEFNYFVSVLGDDLFKVWAADRKTKKYAQLTDDEKKLVEAYCAEQQGESYEGDSRLFGQSWFIAPTIRLSEDLTKAGGKSFTYLYRVESSNPMLKSAHGEELPIVFCHPEMIEGRAFDATFQATMRKMWVEFAKTGNPSLRADISPDGKAKEWPLYDLEAKQVMALDELDIHPEKESALKIVDWDRTYFLTNYYWL